MANIFDVPPEQQKLPQDIFSKASRGLDAALEWTRLPDLFGAIGSGLGGLVNDEWAQIGQESFRELPRTFVNMAPLLIPGAGIPLMAGMMGLDTYAKSGDIGAAGLSAATGLIMPKAAQKAGQLALRGMGQPLEKIFATRAGQALGEGTSVLLRRPANLAQRLGEVTAENAAAAGVQIGAGFAGGAMTGEGYDLTDPRNLFELTVGNIPFFALFDAPKFFHPYGPRGQKFTDKVRKMQQEASRDVPVTRDSLVGAMDKEALAQKPTQRVLNPLELRSENLLDKPIELQQKLTSAIEQDQEPYVSFNGGLEKVASADADGVTLENNVLMSFESLAEEGGVFLAGRVPVTASQGADATRFASDIRREKFLGEMKKTLEPDEMRVLEEAYQEDRQRLLEENPWLGSLSNQAAIPYPESVAFRQQFPEQAKEIFPKMNWGKTDKQALRLPDKVHALESFDTYLDALYQGTLENPKVTSIIEGFKETAKGIKLARQSLFEKLQANKELADWVETNDKAKELLEAASAESDAFETLLNLQEAWAGIQPGMDAAEQAQRLSKIFMGLPEKDAMRTPRGISPETAVTQALVNLYNESKKAAMEDTVSLMGNVEGEKPEFFLKPAYAKVVGDYIKQRAFVDITDTKDKQRALVKKYDGLIQRFEAEGDGVKVRALRKLKQNLVTEMGKGKEGKGEEARAENVDEEMEAFLGGEEVSSDVDPTEDSNIYDLSDKEKKAIEEIPELKATFRGGSVKLQDVTQEIYRRVFVLQEQGVPPEHVMGKINMGRLILRAEGMFQPTHRRLLTKINDAGEEVTHVFSSKEEAEAFAGELNEGKEFEYLNYHAEEDKRSKAGKKFAIVETTNLTQAHNADWDASGDAGQFLPTSDPKISKGLENNEDLTALYHMLEGKEKALETNDLLRRDRVITWFGDTLAARVRRLASDSGLSVEQQAEIHVYSELMFQRDLFLDKGRRNESSLNFALVEETLKNAGLWKSTSEANKHSYMKTWISRMEKQVNKLIHPGGKTMDLVTSRLLNQYEAYTQYKRSRTEDSFVTFQIKNIWKKIVDAAPGLNEAGVPMHVITNPELLKKLAPATYKAYVEGGMVAEAYWDPATQSAFIFPENLQLTADYPTYDDVVRRLFKHEIIGHYGVNDVLGDQFYGFMRQVNRDVISEKDRNYIMWRWGFKDPKDPVIAMEYLALLAEQMNTSKSPLEGKWARVWLRVQKFVENEVPGESLFKQANGEIATPKQIGDLLRAARDRVFMQRGKAVFSDSGRILLPPTSKEKPSDSLDIPRASTHPYFRENPSYTGVDNAATSFYETAVKAHLKRGVELQEAHRSAGQLLRITRDRLSSKDFTAGDKKNTFHGPSPFGGTWRVSTDFRRFNRDMRARDLAHQITYEGLNATDGPVREYREAFLETARTLEAPEKIGVLESLYKDLDLPIPEKIDLTVKGLMNHLGFGLAEGLGHKKIEKLVDTVMAMPGDLGNFARASLKEMARITDVSLDMGLLEDIGLTKGKTVSPAERSALQTYDALRDVVAARERGMSREIKGLTNYAEYLDPSASIVRILYPGTESGVSKYKDMPDSFPKKMSWLSRMGDLVANVAERNPVIRPFLRLASGYQAVAQETLAYLMEPLGIDVRGGKVLKDSRAKTISEVHTRVPLNEGLSKLVLLQNQNIQGLGMQGFNRGKFTPEDLKKIRTRPEFSKLSDEGWGKIVASFEGLQKSNIRARDSLLQRQRQTFAHTVSMELGYQLGWGDMEGISRAADMAQNLLPLFENGGQVMSIADIIQANPKIDPKVLDSVLSGAVQKLSPAYQDLIVSLERKTGYFPEFRLGDFMLRYKDLNGEVKVIGAKSEKELETLRQKVVDSGDFAPNTFQYLDKNNYREMARLLSGTSLEKAQEFENAAFERLRSVVGDQFFEENIRPNYTPLTESVLMEQTKNISDFLRERKLVGGRENLDIIKINQSYIRAIAYGSARSYVQQRFRFLLNSPDLMHNRQVRQYVTDHINNVLRPSGKAEKAIRETAFQYFMALNPSTMAFEALQSVSTLTPWLTRHGAGFFGSYKELTQAHKLVLKGEKSGWGNALYADLVNQATREGLLTRGLWQNVDDPIGLLSAFEEMTPGAKAKEAGKKIAKTYLDATRNLYGLASHYNSRVGFVAGLIRGEALQKAGKIPQGKEALYEFATRTLQVTMMTGGKANRAVGLYSGSAQSQPVRSMIGALMTYVQGMTGMMATSIRDSFGSHLPEAERWQARKGMAQLLGTQFLLAGALGMPGMAAAAALLEQMFPKLELKKNMERIPKEILGGSELGNWLVDSMLYGVPTATSPLDVSGRMGLGQVPGVNELSGFSPETLLGAPAGIVNNIIQGAGALRDGEPTRALEKIAPVFMKNLVKALKDDGAVRSYNGSLVKKMSGTERTLQALGFRPKEIGDYVDQQAQIRKIQALDKEAIMRFNRDMGTSLAKGDVGAVQEALAEKQMLDPLFDKRAAVRTIAERATDSVIPRELGMRMAGDPNRIATAIQGQPGAGNRVTAMDRLTRQIEFETMLGISPGNLKQRYQMASMIDMVLSINPQLTYDQAKRQVSLQLAGLPSPLEQLTF